MTEPPEIPLNEWYYVDNGTKKGPVSINTMRELLRKEEIDTDAQVWRKGMTEWKTIRESDLADLVAAVPPAVSPQHIGNGYVWILAMLPLLWGLIEGAIQANSPGSKGLPVQFTFVINALFGWLDERRLRQAGYGSGWLRAAAIFLVPVYLFTRAKRLKQTPWYAICWLVSFVLGVLVVAAVDAGL